MSEDCEVDKQSITHQKCKRKSVFLNRRKKKSRTTSLRELQNILVFYISNNFLCSFTKYRFLKQTRCIHSQLHCDYSDIAGIRTFMKIEELLV